jgi:hypothetical protein
MRHSSTEQFYFSFPTRSEFCYRKYLFIYLFIIFIYISPYPDDPFSFLCQLRFLAWGHITPVFIYMPSPKAAALCIFLPTVWGNLSFCYYVSANFSSLYPFLNSKTSSTVLVICYSSTLFSRTMTLQNIFCEKWQITSVKFLCCKSVVLLEIVKLFCSFFNSLSFYSIFKALFPIKFHY